MDSFSFNRIEVIESLRPGDMRTGTELVDSLLRPLSTLPGGIPVRFRTSTTAAGFLAILADIESETREGRFSPILHLEVHGSEAGITLGSGDVIDWGTLKGPLAAINVTSRLNLLVVMSACFGLNLVRVLSPVDRAPVWGVVGPSESIKPHELVVAYRRFYESLFASLDGRRALESANASATGGAWRFRPLFARFMFRMMFRAYVSEYRDEAAWRDREADLARAVCERHGATPSRARNFVAAVRPLLRDHQRALDRIGDHFFMKDLYPENAKRFRLTLEECCRHPSDDPS